MREILISKIIPVIPDDFELAVYIGMKPGDLKPSRFEIDSKKSIRKSNIYTCAYTHTHTRTHTHTHTHIHV